MRKLLTISLSALVGFALALLTMQPAQVALGGPGEVCVTRNGDVNADATLDLSESRVSQMHSSILARLKAQMAGRKREFTQAAAI